MLRTDDKQRNALRLPAIFCLLLTCAACAGLSPDTSDGGDGSGLDPSLVSRALTEVNMLQAKGARVWCVPFARDASGIDIRGNANTWWSQAKNEFTRSHTPAVGAVMAFSGTRRLPMGHVAVVSRVISPREIEVDHANWVRNKVSLGMTVVDVSKDNDWSRVRLESHPGSLGSVYKVDGFILPPQQQAI